MILGIPLPEFIAAHVVLSLAGIITGIVVLLGMLGGHTLPRVTALFLVTTLLANATGLAFPIDRKSTRLNSSHVSESRMPSCA